ncbi:MAG: SMC-Scp complex subunit ScpB [Planctomycetia bacterium]|jgi:segregation and condensation protein B
MQRRPTTSRSLAACMAGVPGSRHPYAAIERYGVSTCRRRRLPAATPSDPTRGERLAPGLHVRSDELARLEAALFLAREPLSTRRLAKLAGLSDGTRARTLIRELRRLQEAAGSPVRVEQIAGGFQLLTRAPFGPWIRRLLEPTTSGRLSLSALETLAIVAYRQPVTKADIEAIRGVGSDEMLRQLLDRDYVAIGGRAEDLGRPNVYVTTRRFLAAFGLASLEDLPPVDPLPETAGRPTAGPVHPEG